MPEIKLGKRIRDVRENAGYNQKEFGSLLGIPQSTLSAYENDRMLPTVSTLINIAVKCDVSLDWLCGIENKEREKVVSNDLAEVLSELTEVFANLTKANTEAERFIEELLTRVKGQS